MTPLMTLITLTLLGVGVLAAHMASVMLTQALRTYSRSRLEVISKERGHPNRALEIAREDERAERAWTLAAVLTGLLLAALLGFAVERGAPGLAFESLLVIALAVAAVGHGIAGMFGRVHAELVLDSGWPLARWFYRGLGPVLLMADWMEGRVLRLLSARLQPRPTSVEVEIHSPVDPSEDLEAELSDTARSVLENAIELSRLNVGEIQVPRSRLILLPASATAEEAARVFRDSCKSRIPVYGENRDDIVGILHAKDLFAAWTDPDGPGPSGISPRKLARARFVCVPETVSAYALLDEFSKQRSTMAVVVDEYGSISGLVTFADLVESMVGPIHDEHDADTSSAEIQAIEKHAYIIDASLDIEEINTRLHLDLPESTEYSTLGGLVLHLLGRLPREGESLSVAGVELVVVEVAEHAVRRVRVQTPPSTDHFDPRQAGLMWDPRIDESLASELPRPNVSPEGANPP